MIFNWFTYGITLAKRTRESRAGARASETRDVRYLMRYLLAPAVTNRKKDLLVVYWQLASISRLFASASTYPDFASLINQLEASCYYRIQIEFRQGNSTVLIRLLQRPNTSLPIPPRVSRYPSPYYQIILQLTPRATSPPSTFQIPFIHVPVPFVKPD